MHLLDLTLATLSENLALDEALLLAAEAGEGGEVLRFWEWPQRAVVLGSGGIRSDDVNEERCVRDAVPLARRSSGGGTVLLGRGCMLYSLILSYERSPLLYDIRHSYHFILGRILNALAGVVAHGEQAGISDLVCSGRKFSGNAQQRKRTHLLHHGTLLYEFDIDQVGDYLRLPPRRPEYRQTRSHEAFLMNLPTTQEDLTRRLTHEWQATSPLVHWPGEVVRRLVDEKYSRSDWVLRR